MGFSAALHLPQWAQVSAVYTGVILGWWWFRLFLVFEAVKHLKAARHQKAMRKKAAKENQTFIIRREKVGFYEVG